jgi:hypothetical protein
MGLKNKIKKRNYRKENHYEEQFYSVHIARRSITSNQTFPRCMKKNLSC